MRTRNPLALDDVQVLKARYDIVLNPKLDFHPVIYAFLNHNRRAFDGLQGSYVAAPQLITIQKQKSYLESTSLKQHLAGLLLP
jgi:hypothetical protein